MVRTTTKSRKIKAPTAPRAAPTNATVPDAEPDALVASDQPKVEDVDAKPTEDIVSLGKRDLIDRVVLASGIKKKAAKPVIEAMLKELGDALSRGETLNLQPFGKANVKRQKDLEHAEIIELRLRRSKLAIKAAEAAADSEAPVIPLDPLAEAAE